MHVPYATGGVACKLLLGNRLSVWIAAESHERAPTTSANFALPEAAWQRLSRRSHPREQPDANRESPRQPRFQRGPCGVSSITTPASVSRPRIASASAKSRRARAA